MYAIVAGGRTDWEGTGIEPDLAVPAESALDAALRAAREALRKRAGG